MKDSSSHITSSHFKLPSFHMSRATVIICAGLILTLLYNFTFFRNLLAAYPPTTGNLLFVLSVTILLISITTIFLLLLSWGKAIKPLLITIFLLSSITAYFMDSYNIVIDTTMIQNVVSTNINESSDLVSYSLFLYFFFFGLLPSIVIYKIKFIDNTLKQEMYSKLKVAVVLLIVIVVQFSLFGKNYASFIREHKSLRYYTNPLTSLYSIANYTSNILISDSSEMKHIGLDANIPTGDSERELVILVIGETARADRFSLNGYERQTNPLLSQENVINLSNVHSCGTTTAISVPCMFSIFGKESFSSKKASHTENLLDVVSRAGVDILWRDNNSDSKGVANRVTYQDFKTPSNNPVCDIECRDEGMLDGLDDYIDKQAKGDVLVVLHQMGNHGPAYYKRYPDNFEKFKPACKSINLNECSKEEINNAYDNAILYTDYFLAKVIAYLKQKSKNYETAMVYMSDHGESLSENGLYLHGMPYFIAPEEQKHVAAILWFPEKNEDVDIQMIKARADQPYSHDNLYHTILGLLEVKTSSYDIKKDIVHNKN